MSDPVTRLNAALEGRYRIESELGEGGMATVYLADDLKHERKIALKVLKPELAAVVGHWLIGRRMIKEARGLRNCGCRLRRPAAAVPFARNRPIIYVASL